MFYFKCGKEFYFEDEKELYKVNYEDNLELINEVRIEDENFSKNYDVSEIEIENSIYLMYKIFNLSELKSILQQLKKEKKSAIIEFFDLILYIDKNNKLNTLEIYTRYIEGLNYNIRRLLSTQEKKIYFNDETKLSTINQIINETIKINSNEIVYYLKNDKSIYVTSIFNSLPRDFRSANIKLKAQEYLTLETGYREQSSRVVFPIGRFSIIQKIERTDSKDIIGIPVYSGETASYDDNIRFLVQGGKGHSEIQAYNSFVGECIERYSAKISDKDKIITGTYQELKKKGYEIINPTCMNIDVNNNEIGRFNKKKVYDWVLCTNLKDNNRFLIEASFVFFPYYRKIEYLFNTQSTTGLSSGRNLEEAILQGILEVIERDSYSIKQKANTRAYVINRSCLDFENAKLIEYLKGKGVRCHLIKLNEESEYHVVHCMTEASRIPIFTHGCGASLDINTATRRAILEAIQLRVSQIELFNIEIDQNNKYMKPYFEWAKGNYEYTHIFTERENHRMPTEYKDSRSNNLKKDIDFLVSQIDSPYILIANLSRKELPLNVVRVIIPTYQDIDFNNRKITKRLKTALKGKEVTKLGIFS
ncbi:YcaO-like family protein [Lagierella sp.]|uniref:YcaO-like family protein n=1 Tax=Lagierella sp. TaxID=2849657 RepID=UPI00263310D3|nr:YcaO-like family protein [Lagierella sp.]